MLQTVHPDRPKVPIAGGPPAYLAFLKWHPDGRFRPVTGDYDSTPSFRLVSTVFPDRGQYEADNILGLKAAIRSPVTPQPPR